MEVSGAWGVSCVLCVCGQRLLQLNVTLMAFNSWLEPYDWMNSSVWYNINGLHYEKSRGSGVYIEVLNPQLQNPACLILMVRKKVLNIKMRTKRDFMKYICQSTYRVKIITIWILSGIAVSSSQLLSGRYISKTRYQTRASSPGKCDPALARCHQRWHFLAHSQRCITLQFSHSATMWLSENRSSGRP